MTVIVPPDKDVKCKGRPDRNLASQKLPGSDVLGEKVPKREPNNTKFDNQSTHIMN